MASDLWPKIESVRRLVPLLVVAIVLTTAFIHLVHLGIEIEDPEVGTFRSFFSTEQLAVINEERALIWAVDPPGELTPFEKEDWFRTQAGWHMVARNKAEAVDDWQKALSENRILEKHYSAFLDTPDRFGNLRRFSKEQLRIMTVAVGEGLEEQYRSTADNGRIWLRPSPALHWGTCVLLLIGLGLVWRVLGRAGS